MLVEVKPYRPRCVLSKREVDGGQYRIDIDGRLAGFIGYQEGARPMLLEKRSPLELREIERAVRVQLMPQKVGTAVFPPDDPPAEPKPDARNAYG